MKVPENLLTFDLTKTDPLKSWTMLLIVITALCCTKGPVNKLATQLTPTSFEFKKGEAFFNSNSDSAFYYFNIATETSRDSLLVAMAFTYMAIIQQDVGDHLGSQESLLAGLRHLSEKNSQHHYCMASIYNELGVSSAGLKNYDDALHYYELAISFQQDENYRTVVRNNMAVAYREKGDYPKSIKILQAILEKQRSNNLEYARSLTNLVNAQSLADPSYYPIPKLVEALNIRLNEKDDIGITVSYHHIADYYLPHQRDSALLYARRMNHFAQRINNADEKLDALRKLITLEQENESKKYFKIYEILNDSVQSARNKAKNQYALIKYHSEKNKSENLILQQDNSKKELKIFQQRVGLYSAITAMILISVFVWWLFRKKKQKIEWQSMMTIREHQLETSQKVHDVVANGLYQIMSEIEHKERFEKEHIMDKLELLYERSRDISYEPAADERSVEQQINNLLESFGTAQTKVSIVGNDEKIWNSVELGTVKELEIVLRELMVNMAKHSSAKHVVLRFEHVEGTLNITYRDDGIGFPKDFKYGTGLASTETRIKRINGEFIFTADKIRAGASLKIMIPIK
jgi:tetratricopeptide (TPR) repeat protein